VPKFVTCSVAIVYAMWLDPCLITQLKQAKMRCKCKQRQTQDLLLDFEAAAFALSSSLRAAFAETLRLATRLWIQWIRPAFAFYSRLRFSVSQ
jgi:hypothetical protein